jgi:hypothetical protein
VTEPPQLPTRWTLPHRTGGVRGCGHHQLQLPAHTSSTLPQPSHVVRRLQRPEVIGAPKIRHLAGYSAGGPLGGALGTSEHQRGTPIIPICAQRGLRRPARIAVHNGGDGRVHVLGRWSHSVSTRGRGVLACPASCAEPIDGSATFTTGMSLAVRNALSGVGALSLGLLCAILATGRPSGTAPGGRGIVPV